MPSEQQDLFEGGAFSEELPVGRASGTLDLADGMVRFHSDVGHAAFPVKGLEISRGGASNKIYFLKHQGCPDWTLFTSDAALLNHPALKTNESVAEQTESLRRRRLTGLIALGGLAVLLVLTVIGLVLAQDWMVAKLARQVPVTWEEKIGESAFSPMEANARIIGDSVLLAEFDKLSARLVNGIGSQRYKFKFYILRNESVNAFALPGGTMAVHTGLLLAAESAEEVVGVMAHEIAHVTEQHSVRMLIKAVGLYTVVMALFGDATGLMAVVANNAPALLTMQFSRDHERQADERGFEYLLHANVNPRGMITFFRKLQKLESARAGLDVPDLLKTHPATNKRIEHLEHLLAKKAAGEKFTPIDLNYAAFKEKLRAHLNIKP